MTDDRFDDFVRRAGQDYHRPPKTPREAMWARITATRAERRAQRALRPSLPQLWVRWGLAAAAVLVLGIGIGVTIGRRPPRPSGMQMAAGPAGATGQMSTAVEIATADHLRQVETFLALFRADAQSRPMGQAAGLARELLQNTRLFMDSPAGQDPHLAALLGDVEVVLAQISSYTGSHDGSELKLIDQGIEQRGLLLKLRAAVPAPFGAARAQGVL